MLRPRTIDVAPDVATVMMAFAMKETGHLGVEGRGTGNVGSESGSSRGGESVSIKGVCNEAIRHC